MSNYNGYKNYETWCWNLWIQSERQSQTEIDQLARNYIATSRTKDDAIYSLEQTLKEQALEAADDLELPSGPFADLLGAAMKEIDFRELAGLYVDAVVE
jgi:hypothetical protein